MSDTPAKTADWFARLVGVANLGLTLVGLGVVGVAFWLSRPSCDACAQPKAVPHQPVSPPPTVELARVTMQRQDNGDYWYFHDGRKLGCWRWKTREWFPWDEYRRSWGFPQNGLPHGYPEARGDVVGEVK